MNYATATKLTFFKLLQYNTYVDMHRGTIILSFFTSSICFQFLWVACHSISRVSIAVKWCFIDVLHNQLFFLLLIVFSLQHIFVLFHYLKIAKARTSLQIGYTSFLVCGGDTGRAQETQKKEQWKIAKKGLKQQFIFSLPVTAMRTTHFN